MSDINFNTLAENTRTIINMNKICKCITPKQCSSSSQTECCSDQSNFSSSPRRRKRFKKSSQAENFLGGCLCNKVQGCGGKQGNVLLYCYKKF